MIGIKLEGEDKRLQLKRDTSISITLENPIFGTAEQLSPGSYSLPFDIPGGDESPENASLLKNPDVIENAEQYAINKALLEVSEDDNLIPFKAGELKVRGSVGNNITCNFNFGITQLSPELKKLKLRDILNENIVISSASVYKKIYVKPKDASAYSLEVNGKVYTGNYIDIQALINADGETLADTGEYVPWSNIENTNPTPGGLAAPYLVIRMAKVYSDMITPPFYSPDPFIPFAVKKVADNGDPYDAWQIEGDLGTYYAGFDSFLAGYISGVYPTTKIRFPLTFNLATFYTSTEGELAQKWTEFVNAVDSGGVVKNDPNAAIFKNTNSLQPYLRLKYVLDKIADAFGIEMEGDFMENTDIMERLLDNSYLLDYPLEFTNGYKFLFWKRSFNLGDLAPDMTAIDFLKAIATRYNLAVYLNELSGRLRLQFREPMVKSYQYEDITSMCSPGKGGDDQRVTGIRYNVEKDDSDLLAVDDMRAFGTPETEIEVKCGHILTSRTYGLDGKVVSGPRVNRKAGEKFTLRLFQYTGIADTGTFTYPSAAITGSTFNDRFDDIGNNITAVYHFYWALYLMKKKTLKLNVNFPLRMLTRIDWEIKRRFDRTNYFLKSLTVKVKTTGVEVTEVQMHST